MANLARINARIKTKLAELDDDKEERQRAHLLVQRRDARIDHIRIELKKARRRIRRRRALFSEVEADLHEAEQAEDTEEKARLQDLLDCLAGEIDEAITLRDRLLNRLDRMQDRKGEAQRVLAEAIAESAEDREALKRLRARRRRAKAQRDKGEKPSPNFDYAEFDCNDGTPAPKESYPAIDHLCQNVLEPLRAKYGACHVNSGHRHAAYNARIGGASLSVHIYDLPGRNSLAVAADCTFERGTPTQWYASSKADGRGLYNSFVHHDNRNRFSPPWPDATWRG